MEKSRPFSAYPLPTKANRMAQLNLNPKESNFKERISPQRHSNFYTKEDLYQKIQSLKSENNSLKNENKMLKAKIIRLERKKPVFAVQNGSKSQSNFANGSENQKALFKFAEIDFENKILKEDILKQKTMIEELSGNPPPDYKKIYEKYVSQCIKIKKLKNDIQRLNLEKNNQDIEKNIYRASSPVYPQSSASNRGKVKPKTQENQKFSEIISKIYDCSCMNKLDLDEIWYVINPNGRNSIDFIEFFRGLNGLKVEVPREDLEKFFHFLSPESTLTNIEFDKALKVFKPLNKVSFSELKVPIQHLEFKLQIQRLNFNGFIQCIQSESLNSNDFARILLDSPLQLEKEMSDVIGKYVFGNNLNLGKEIIEQKLKTVMSDWKVFTEDQELEFDDEIKKKLSNNWDAFLKKCKELDIAKKEVITYYDFKQTCHSLGFDVKGDIESYLKVLFYTDKFILDIVPYYSFIVAYAPENN